jgi:hypothetical protein
VKSVETRLNYAQAFPSQFLANGQPNLHSISEDQLSVAFPISEASIGLPVFFWGDEMAVKPVTFSSAHAARIRSLGNKSIPGSVVVSRFCNCLGLPPGVDPTKSVDDLLGGNLQRWDLGLDLMKYPAFKVDGLVLQKSDVEGAGTVSQLGDLVFKWYVTNGWTITKG